MPKREIHTLGAGLPHQQQDMGSSTWEAAHQVAGMRFLGMGMEQTTQGRRGSKLSEEGGRDCCRGCYQILPHHHPQSLKWVFSVLHQLKNQYRSK